MSNIDSKRPPNAVLYSERLLGLRSECPLCSEREISTGWLLYHDDAQSYWYLDLECTGCRSRGATWRQEWQPLINEVLEAKVKEGFDLAPVTMRGYQNTFLTIGGALSALAALLHVGCIVFGASWYRFFGAGEQMARMAAAGHWYPTILTSIIVAILSVWSLYALSGAGVIRRLPLVRPALCIITSIYLLRALAFTPFYKYFPGNSAAFWLWSSATCLVIGLVHLVGLRQSWRRLRPAA